MRFLYERDDVNGQPDGRACLGGLFTGDAYTDHDQITATGYFYEQEHCTEECGNRDSVHSLLDVL